jgi:integrase/recombinase XerD
MRATKIIHNGESRIKVDFPYNQELAQVLKKIPGAKWSRTFNAWHIPYRKTEFNQLKILFPEVEYPERVIDVKTVEPTTMPPKVNSNRQPQPTKSVSVQVIGRSIVIKLPKNALDTHFIVSLR